eukprot:COSAG03_NODE_552_length_6970_cov_232.041140_6_plen_170_part_00
MLEGTGRHVSGVTVGVVRTVRSPTVPRPRGAGHAGASRPNDRADSATARHQRADGGGLWRRRCCACHRCRRGLLSCFSREACAHTTHVLLALGHGDAAPLGCNCPDRWVRELPSRLTHISGPVVVAFGLGGMSYSTYLGFTAVLPLLAPPQSVRLTSTCSIATHFLIPI